MAGAARFAVVVRWVERRTGFLRELVAPKTTFESKREMMAKLRKRNVKWRVRTVINRQKSPIGVARGEARALTQTRWSSRTNYIVGAVPFRVKIFITF